MHPHPVIEYCPECNKGYYDTHLDDSLKGAESFGAEHSGHPTEEIPIHKFDIGMEDGIRYFRVRRDGSKEKFYLREDASGTSSLLKCDNLGSRIFDEKYAPVKHFIDLANVVNHSLQAQK